MTSVVDTIEQSERRRYVRGLRTHEIVRELVDFYTHPEPGPTFFSLESREDRERRVLELRTLEDELDARMPCRGL